MSRFDPLPRMPNAFAGTRLKTFAATRLGFTPTIFVISASASDSERAQLRAYRNRLKRQRRARGAS